MENIHQFIETWIIEYLAHKCVKVYFEDGCNGNLLLKNQDICVLTSYLNEGNDNLSRREYVCLVFLHLLCLEESLTKHENHIDSDYIGTDDFKKSLSHHIAFASRDSDNASTKKLARNCLIQTQVVVFKYCLRNNADWKGALNDFHDFVTLMPIAECKEMYDKCAKMKEVQPDDDFISEYMDLIRHLVLTLYSEFDDPYLIKLAQSKETYNNGMHTEIEDQKDKRNSTSPPEANLKNNEDAQRKDDAPTDKITPELKLLLRDTRPSRMSDLEEIKLEENDILSKIRKKADKFNPQKHFRNVIRLEKRIKRKPPSHQNFRGGPWMLEEETAFIRATLNLGVGRWAVIKAALKTFRSSQQLKDKWKSLQKWRIDEVKNDGNKVNQSRRKICKPLRFEAD